MLLKKFNHLINNQLPERIEKREIKQVLLQFRMFGDKVDDVGQLPGHHRVYKGDETGKFVDAVVHVYHSRFVRRFDLRLQIRQQPISQQRNQQEAGPSQLNRFIISRLFNFKVVEQENSNSHHYPYPQFAFAQFE